MRASGARVRDNHRRRDCVGFRLVVPRPLVYGQRRLLHLVTAPPPTQQSGDLRLEPLPELESVRGEWNELARASGNIFATPEWVSIWLRHFARGHRLLASACRTGDGRLAAILPLYLWSRRLGIVRFIGHDAGDQLGPICAPADLVPAARALRRALSDAPWSWGLFMGEWLPADADWAALLGGRRVRSEGSPIMRLEAESWEDVSGRWSGKLRKNLRYAERRMAREHQLAYRLANDPNRLSLDLDALFALHAARWTSKSTFGRREAFHREFARTALERGWLRLWFLEIDETPIAAWYGFRFAGAECHYQGGWDPRWSRWSPGLLLLVHTIRSALDDGARTYRFLRGAEEYKYRFAHDDDGLETIAVVNGARGRALLAAALAAKRFRLL